MSQYRSMWKGHIRFGLVTVPVKAFSATESEGEVRLRQLHKDCHRPINYRKVCPVHGEITNDQIVSGYEHQKDQYVIIDTAELDKLRTEGEKGINIEGFVPAGEVDPLYFSGKTHYLLPEGPVGLKPYLLLHRVMTDTEQVGVAKLFWFGRENVVLVRPLERLIAMGTLTYDSSLRKPEAFEGELPEASEFSAEELKMAQMLIEASSLPELDMSQYKDHYREEVLKLVEAKVAGKEIVAPPSSEAPKVIDLMEALKRSLDEAQKKAELKPARRKMAASGRRPAAQGKKKSG